MRSLDKVKQLVVAYYNACVISEWDRLGLLGKKITIRNSRLALQMLISEYDFDKGIGAIYGPLYTVYDPVQEEYICPYIGQGFPCGMEDFMREVLNLKNKGIIEIIETDSSTFITYTFTPLFHRLWNAIKMLEGPDYNNIQNGILTYRDVYKEGKIIAPSFYEDLKYKFSLDFKITELEYLGYDKEKVNQLKEIHNYILEKESECSQLKESITNIEKNILQNKKNLNNKVVDIIESNKRSEQVV